MAGSTGGGALAGLAGHYGSDSEDDADQSGKNLVHGTQRSMWSVCVDPNTGCPYYWDQISNQVSWELPPGVVIPPNPIVPTVSAKNPNRFINNTTANKVNTTNKRILEVNHIPSILKVSKHSNLPSSDEEEEKIELITSYYNSDSGSGDENTDRSNKKNKLTQDKSIIVKNKSTKKIDIPPQPYGPELPESVKTSQQPSDHLSKDKKNISVSIDKQKNENLKDAQSSLKITFNEKNDDLSNKNIQFVEENSENTKINIKNENCNGNSKNVQKLASDEAVNLDDLMLVQANLLKKLGELGPNDIKYLNGANENRSLSNSRTHSPLQSPATVNSPGNLKKSTALDMDVDDLIAQIEKEQPVDQPSASDVSSIGNVLSQDGSVSNKSTSVIDEIADSKVSFRPLFPSANFSSILDISVVQKKEKENIEIEIGGDDDSKIDKTSMNKYEISTSICDGVENSAFKRKRRIALDVLPIKKQVKSDESMFKKDLLFTTRYAQNNEISGERVGLGFSSEIDEDLKKEDKYSYPNFKKGDSLVFHKADSLNSETTVNIDKEGTLCKNSDISKDLECMKSLIEAKLKFLVQNLSSVSPVQQLFIELHTLWGAMASGALQKEYIHEWLLTADTTLARLEASAAPHPWICRFHSGAGCYVYEHAETGKIQWEHPENETPQPPPTPPPAKPPAPPSPLPNEPTDMDISTTPPPQSHDTRSNMNNEHMEPLPPGVETPTSISPHMLSENLKFSSNDLINNFHQNDSSVQNVNSDKLGAELDSFYLDLAALEDTPSITEKKMEKEVSVQVVKKDVAVKNNLVETPVVKEKKKKSKIKTPSTMKDKSVSKLVEKWKKVQETIHN